MTMQPFAARSLATVLAVTLAAGTLAHLDAQGPTQAGAAQSNSSQSSFALTIDNIMRGPQLYGYPPGNVRWSGDGKSIYFDWKDAGEAPQEPLSTWVIAVNSGPPRRLSEEEARQAPPASGDTTEDRSQTVFARDGDLYLYNWTRAEMRRLTSTVEPESNPHFTQDERAIGFTSMSNLYVMPLDGTGPLEQLTDIRAAGKGPKEEVTVPVEVTTSQQFLIRQENELIGAVRDQIERRQADEAKAKRLNPRVPFVLEEGQTVAELTLCPNRRCVIAQINQAPKGDKKDDVPNYITESGYTAVIPGRSNVGDVQEITKIAVIDAATGAVEWMNTGLGDREVLLYSVIFNRQGTRAAMIARAVDNKDRWILALPTGSSQAQTVFTEHDDAWVKWPDTELLEWLPGGNQVYFLSERDGWAHLYTARADGTSTTGAVAPRQLTSGSFEVDQVTLSNNGRTFYLTTSEATPAERHFYSMNIDGGTRTRITAEAGKHEVVLSRDESQLADVHSYVNRPPELFTGANRPGAPLIKRTTSPAPDFFNYAWLDAPIVHVPSRDGTMIPARLFKPDAYQPGGPAVVFVHGAGYLQNVHKYWSPSYPREYLFHHFLMEQGYVVLDLDYRASAGYGRDWRTAIYRHMGGKDLEDNVDGARWLVAQHGVDPARIGIYGGSYGGFITLMAMFTTPDVFAAGAALRPVTDWAHYNHGYTSDILNSPQGDPEAYRQSSPIYFAEGLKGALLIAHGMVDTNVFFQDTVRLTQRLIELRKENWSVAMYPVESHGFLRPESWADEYKRIFRLFETNLKPQ